MGKKKKKSADLLTADFGGNLSASQLLIDTAQNHPDAQMAIVVLITEDDLVTVGHSDGQYLEKVGILEIAKQIIMEGMHEY